jgi:hypothetical protein
VDQDEKERTWAAFENACEHLLAECRFPFISSLKCINISEPKTTDIMLTIRDDGLGNRYP